VTGGPWHRSENVAFDAFSCATVHSLSEGEPAKWLKNKNLQNHLCDYEPGGREFESLRARQKIFIRSGVAGRVPRFIMYGTCQEWREVAIQATDPRQRGTKRLDQAPGFNSNRFGRTGPWQYQMMSTIHPMRGTNVRSCHHPLRLVS
jgi:hypothetical protein